VAIGWERADPIRAWAPRRIDASFSYQLFLEFLGGVVVLVAASDARSQEPGRPGAEQDATRGLAAWLQVDEDGTVAAYTGKVEFGQDIRTSLSQAVAEELHVPLARVRLVMGGAWAWTIRSGWRIGRKSRSRGTTRTHWITEDSTDPRPVPDAGCDAQMAMDLVPGAVCPGYFLELLAIRSFAFEHGGQQIPVDPGADIATHVNIVTSVEACPPPGCH
jgi:hypothetical protein